MATVLVQDIRDRKTATESTTSLGSHDVPPLGAPHQAKQRFWFQRTKDFDNNAIATQVRRGFQFSFVLGVITDEDFANSQVSSTIPRRRSSINRAKTGMLSPL